MVSDSYRLYCKRNVIERFFNRIKHFRCAATRYDKRVSRYLVFASLTWHSFANKSITIDVGANIGLTVLTLSGIYKNGMVIAVEPVPASLLSAF